jgi:hypothetical protein
MQCETLFISIIPSFLYTMGAELGIKKESNLFVHWRIHYQQ